MIDTKNIRCFEQHGFVHQKDASDGNVVGRCPLCGKDDHFYLHVEKKLWDCKRCGASGGFQKLLDELVKIPSSNDVMNKLARNRGVSLDTLRHFDIGYSEYTGAHLIPVYDTKREHVWDLRMYSGKKIISTAGCKVGLFNWPDLAKDYDTIYLCEGEWDAIALWEARTKSKAEPAAIVAVPGAGTFRPEWSVSFAEKRVVVLYDNDLAGEQGSKRVSDILSSVASSIRFIRWPEGTPSGFDIRDLYKKEGAKGTIGFIESHLTDAPKGAEQYIDEKAKPKSLRENVKLDGPGMSADQVYAAYRKWLLLPDTLTLDFLFGAVIANRLPGDPLWGLIVGPPGATKTELLISLTDSPMIATASAMTPQSLVSGFNYSGGADPSMIPQWNGKVVVFKDMTTLLSMNKIQQDEVFSILREAYDGPFKKTFGNGVQRSFHSRFGLIAGVTPIIEMFAETHASMGERFLRFPILAPNTIEEKLALARRAADSKFTEDAMRADLRSVAKEVLSFKFENNVEISHEMTEKLLHAALLLATLRPTIFRDNFSKEITYKPVGEVPTRLTKQFQKILHGVTQFRRLELADDRGYEVIKRIVIGTIPSRMHDVLKPIYKKNKHASYDLEILSQYTKLPSTTTQRLLDGMCALGALDRSSYANSLKTEWHLTEDIKTLLDMSEVYL